MELPSQGQGVGADAWREGSPLELSVDVVELSVLLQGCPLSIGNFRWLCELSVVVELSVLL